jgi:hypothetical protein
MYKPVHSCPPKFHFLGNCLSGKKGCRYLDPTALSIKKAAGFICPRLLFPNYSLKRNRPQADAWKIIVIKIGSA